MKKTISGYSLFVFVLFLLHQNVYAQIGHGTSDPSKASVVEMLSPSKGLLIPRVALTSLTSFSPIQGESATNETKVNSLLVYNTATAGIAPNNVTPGYYYWTTETITDPGRWNRLVNDADIAALGLNVTADNGLTMTGDNIQLGGALTDPTSIETDATNTLAIEGLQTGSTTDRVVVADPTTGVLKQLKAALPKFFYMPSIIMPTDPSQVVPGESSHAGGVYTIDLHARYAAQFGGTVPSGSIPNTQIGIRSAGAPHLPVLPNTELYYYITWWDSDVFEDVEVSPLGVLTYKIKSGADPSVGSFMNIVFAVKE